MFAFMIKSSLKNTQINAADLISNPFSASHDFNRLLVFFGSLYCKQNESCARSDCSHGSSLIWVHFIGFMIKYSMECTWNYAADVTRAQPAAQYLPVLRQWGHHFQILKGGTFILVPEKV